MQEAVATAKPAIQDETKEDKEEATSNSLEAVAIGVSCGLGVLFVGGLVGTATWRHFIARVS